MMAAEVARQAVPISNLSTRGTTALPPGKEKGSLAALLSEHDNLTYSHMCFKHL